MPTYTYTHPRKSLLLYYIFPSLTSTSKEFHPDARVVRFEWNVPHVSGLHLTFKFVEDWSRVITIAPKFTIFAFFLEGLEISSIFTVFDFELGSSFKEVWSTLCCNVRDCPNLSQIHLHVLSRISISSTPTTDSEVIVIIFKVQSCIS